jgi:hypothetical protein
VTISRRGDVRSGVAPRIRGSDTIVGLREQYCYEPGPAGRDETHVHAAIQLCLSRNSDGRYRSGRWTVDVPAGAVSAIDAWEPHAAEDPAPQTDASHYDVLYVTKARWEEAAAAIGRNPRFGAIATRRRDVVQAMRRLLHALDERDSALAVDTAWLALVDRLIASPAHESTNGCRVSSRAVTGPGSIAPAI